MITPPPETAAGWRELESLLPRLVAPYAGGRSPFHVSEAIQRSTGLAVRLDVVVASMISKKCKPLSRAEHTRVICLLNEFCRDTRTTGGNGVDPRPVRGAGPCRPLFGDLEKFSSVVEAHTQTDGVNLSDWLAGRETAIVESTTEAENFIKWNYSPSPVLSRGMGIRSSSMARLAATEGKHLSHGQIIQALVALGWLGLDSVADISDKSVLARVKAITPAARAMGKPAALKRRVDQIVYEKLRFSGYSLKWPSKYILAHQVAAG